MSLRVMVALTLAAILLLPVSAVWAGGETTLRITISPSAATRASASPLPGQGATAGIPVKVMLVADGDTGEGSIADVECKPGRRRHIFGNPHRTQGRRGWKLRGPRRATHKNGGLIHFWWVGSTWAARCSR